MASIGLFDIMGDPRCCSDADGVPIGGSVVAFGVFDGFHAGHMSLLGRAIEDARKRCVPVVVLTFDVDPDELLHRDCLKKLMDNADRICALASADVDAVKVIRFNESLASLEPQDFLSLAFGGAVPASLHVGENLRFGRGAKGDVLLLEEWGRSKGMDVVASPLLEMDGGRVSSTRIRLLLQEGSLEEANHLLGHAYEVRGRVVHGANLGAQLGFRTANLILAEDRMVLADGVYAAYADVDGVRYKSAVNVGLPPTFEGERVANIEAHILDFEDDIYDRRISLSFMKRLRPLVKFDSVEELKRVVTRNFQEVRELL